MWNLVHKGNYLIEEKISQSEELSEFYSSSVNSFRIIVIKTNDGKWNVAPVSLKIGSGGSQTDNFCEGGVLTFLDDSGKIIYASLWPENKKIIYHPDTGRQLDGITLKCYREVIDFAIYVSNKFNFMGTIGWDIGISEKGPLIVEGNAFYDCSYFQLGPQGGLISEIIAKGLKKKNMLSRWDRRKIHPHFDKKKIIA